MVRAIIAFVVVFVLIFTALSLWGSMSKRERFGVLKRLLFSSIVAALTLVLIFVFVEVF